MTPNCLRVDKAIIFFISISDIAINPAINIVTVAVRSKVLLNMGDLFKVGANRIKRKTPAVTRVEEWTKAETGVGAAIAAGNQAEKGIWALLVIAATIIVAHKMVVEVLELIANTFHESKFTESAIEIKRRTSPSRLVKAVIRPALQDFGFL